MTAERKATLVREIAAHKAAIRHHRSALGQKKEELTRLQCAEVGIKVVAQGEGKHPWPESSNSHH